MTWKTCSDNPLHISCETSWDNSLDSPLETPLDNSLAKSFRDFLNYFHNDKLDNPAMYRDRKKEQEGPELSWVFLLGVVRKAS